MITMIMMTGDNDDDNDAMVYSKHHAAERWDLEFDPNTTEKFENSLKNLNTQFRIR